MLELKFSLLVNTEFQYIPPQKKWNPTVVKSGNLKLRTMSKTNCDRMNAEQPNSTAPSLLRNRSSWKKGGKTLSPGVCDKEVLKCEMWKWKGSLICTKQLCSQERMLEQSAAVPGPRIGQRPQGLSPVQRQIPDFLSEPDCVPPIWSPNGCTSCKEKRHLVDFAHSCSAHSQVHFPSFPAVFLP